MPARKYDYFAMIGQTFGRLTVQSKRKHKGHTLFSCLCSCGQVCEIQALKIVDGHTKSCGCLRAEVTSLRRTRHGLTKTTVYRIWSGMRNRCQNPKTPKFKDYGGRGIQVCDRWQNFEAFLEDMGHPPPGMSIDRRENDGPYAPWNCHWASPKEQANNRRKSDQVGARHPMAKLADDQVREIKLALKNPYYGQLADLGKKYGVTTTAILLIKTNKNWKHIL